MRARSSLTTLLCGRGSLRRGRVATRPASEQPEDPAAAAIEILRMSEYIFRVSPEHWGGTDAAQATGYLEGTACPWVPAGPAGTLATAASSPVPGRGLLGVWPALITCRRPSPSTAAPPAASTSSRSRCSCASLARRGRAGPSLTNNYGPSFLPGGRAEGAGARACADGSTASSS